MNDALLCYLNKIDEFSLLYTHLKFVKNMVRLLHNTATSINGYVHSFELSIS